MQVILNKIFKLLRKKAPNFKIYQNSFWLVLHENDFKICFR